MAAALVLLAATGLALLRVWPPFAVVMSGSMAPTIKTGDMVVLAKLRTPARVGDIVAVPVPDEARARYGYPPVVIHRVLRITGGQIRTKGDARPAADPFTVPRTAVDAKVVADIPAGGRFLAFFRSAPGLLWLLAGAVLFFGRPLLVRAGDARRRETEATAQLRDQLATVTSELARLQSEQERSRQAAIDTLSQLDRLARLVEQAVALGQAAASSATSEEPSCEPVGTGGVFDEPADAIAAPLLTGDPRSPVASPGEQHAGEPVDTVPIAAERADAAHAAAVAAAETRAVEPSRLIPAVAFPSKSRSVVASKRWDAPPPATSLTASGWTGVPPVRLARWQRAGRLIAASAVT